MSQMWKRISITMKLYQIASLEKCEIHPLSKLDIEGERKKRYVFQWKEKNRGSKESV